MFGQMMGSINDDYLKYVMHAQVVVEEPEEVDLSKASFSAQDEPVQSPGSVASAAAADAGQGGGHAEAQAQPPQGPVTQAPVVKAEHERIGRNDPCYCGSGRKFKHCHGA